MSSNGANGSSTPQDRAGSQKTTTETSQDTAKRTKRKKASRACFHCQKAHLTCDDSRPCQRCIKRGLDATCQDGIRKKAKYLQDVEDQTQVNPPVLVQTTSNDDEPHDNLSIASVPQITEIRAPEGTVNLAAMTQPLRRSIYTQDNFGVFGDNLLFDYPPLSSYDFDSKAANMEYSMLSNMLGNAGTPGTDYSHHSPDTYAFSSPSMNNLQKTMPSRQHTITPDQAGVNSEVSWSQLQLSNTNAQQNKHLMNNGAGPNAPAFRTGTPQTIQVVAPHDLEQQVPKSNGASTTILLGNTSPLATSKAAQTSAKPTKPPVAQGNVDPHGQRPTPVARRPPSTTGNDSNASIYKSITQPFSYTNGYHLLNTYLRSRFEKEDLLRIARAIVGYRPSFIALTKTLREEDLVFMEICFQRTLLEYEKFVGYSGTPTIIWRRTGQIELVGKEFCLLTQWSREQLLAKQTFIVELMDDSSVIEYFEKFSAHAFGDTSSVQTTCVLMTPQKRAVPCAFCFTIKRDVFDIPTMIVGNFLPIL